MNQHHTEREAAAVLHLASLLRSMASSYAAGPQWDALDSKAVTDAATVLEGFARSQQPATATNTREALTRIAEICECHPMYLGAGLSIEEICKEGGDAATITDMAYIAREALEAADVEVVQPATAVPADLPQALRVALEDLDSFESLGPTTEAVINAAQQWYLSVPAAPPATAVQAASPGLTDAEIDRCMPPSYLLEDKEWKERTRAKLRAALAAPTVAQAGVAALESLDTYRPVWLQYGVTMHKDVTPNEDGWIRRSTIRAALTAPSGQDAAPAGSNT